MTRDDDERCTCQDALLDALADMSPGMVSSYAVVVECLTPDGETGICVESMHGQTTTQTLGLLSYATNLIHSETWKILKDHSD